MSDGINDCGPMETWSRNDKGELVRDESHPPLVVVVRPTQSELYDRACTAFNFLRPVNIGCKDSPQNDAWDELAWCLLNLKPREAADAPPPHD